MKEERMQVLKMVEDGKLSVEDALKLLEQLEKTAKTENKQPDFIKEISDFVQFDEKKKANDPGYDKGDKIQSTKERIFDFVDSALKKIKDFELDLNFGKHIDISHIFQQSDAVIKKIDVDVANGHIKLTPWDQKDVRIECQARVYRVDSQEQAKSNFLEDVTFGIKGETLYFSTGQKWLKLDATIYVPQEQYEQIKVRMFNGAIESKDLSVDQYKVKTANGKIKMDGIKGKSVEAETANGAIKIRNSVIKDIDVETLNGSIKLEGDFQKVELQSFNGNVECRTYGSQCESIDAKTTTGNIELLVPSVASVNGELKSNLGHFTVDLEGIQVVEDKSELIQKTMKFKSISEAEKRLYLFADSKTGAIKVSKAEITSEENNNHST